MKAEEIYAVLERIRSFVQSHTLPDGSFPANSPNIGISLELCEKGRFTLCKRPFFVTYLPNKLFVKQQFD